MAFFSGCFFFLLVVWGGLPQQASALVESQPVHFSGDQQIWDRKIHQVRLLGHAAITQSLETLTADEISLNLESRLLDARGHCAYMTGDSVLWGEEMHFDLKAHAGSVMRGRVANSAFSLRGERIDKLEGVGRYHVEQGSYSTCIDCAASWSIDAEQIDLEMEGYAVFRGMTTRIKGIPAIWLPYFIFPLKTQRQTGFLIPRIGFSGAYGPTVVVPFFWAIHPSADMTLVAGQYFGRGPRGELEARYLFHPEESAGTAKAFYNYLSTEQKFENQNFPVGSQRWGVDWQGVQALPQGVLARWHLVQMSDNFYSYQYPDDLPRFANEAFVKSMLLLHRTGHRWHASLALQNFRNLLNTDPGGTPNMRVLQNDPRTVQLIPHVLITRVDHSPWDLGWMTGMSVSLSRFTRPAGFFDYDATSDVPFGQLPSDPQQPYRLGVDPLRQANRLMVTPSVYRAFRIKDVVSVVPSLSFKGLFYDFAGAPNVPSLFQGYALLQTEVSAQFEKVYDFPDQTAYPKAKHVIRPLLTYSLMPFRSGDGSQPQDHPFLRQIYNGQNRGSTNSVVGYNFDNHDIIPYSYVNNGPVYLMPLGHSLAYGFSSQWIIKKMTSGSSVPEYKKRVELNVTQAVNFLEINRVRGASDRPHILNQFRADLEFHLDQLESVSSYLYNPDFSSDKRTSFNTSLSYVFEKAMHQGVFAYERSFFLRYTFAPLQSTDGMETGFTFAINDYVIPNFAIEYNFAKSLTNGIKVGLDLQNASRCWKLKLGANYVTGLYPGSVLEKIANNTTFNFELNINLDGTGFRSFDQLSNQLASQSSGG